MNRLVATMMLSLLAAVGSTVAQDKANLPATNDVTPAAAPDGSVGAEVRADEETRAGDTHVRIVRLSEIRGKVAMDRNVGHGTEVAIQNMPIAQNMALATGKDGFAEVEFEDGSSLRLAPESEVRFVLLVLRSSGAKASTIAVDRGTVYASLEKTKDTEFTLAANKTRIAVSPGTHLRLDLTGPKKELAVISGQASVATDGGAPQIVAKKQTMTLDTTAGSGQTEVAKGIYESPYDGWDKDAVTYHQRYMKTSANAGSTALYGVSDLNYYGSFVGNSCGGTFWQPYFVSAGWNPYSNGLWALYPGGNYSWVSPYPWGWLPFHTGAWSFCPSSGWGWRPGGSFYGVRNIAILNPSPINGGMAGGSLSPAHPPGVVGGPHPPHPPTGGQSLMMQSSAPMVRSMMDRSDNFVFRRDSAGLGIPRGALGGLHGISRDVERHGFANREVYAESTATPHSMMDRGMHGDGARPQGAAPMTLHRGPTPEGMGNGNDRFGWKNGQGNPGPQQTQGGQNRPVNNASGSFGHQGGRPAGGGDQQGGFNRGGGSPGGGQSGGGFNRGGGGAPAGGGGGAGRGAGPASATPH